MIADATRPPAGTPPGTSPPNRAHRAPVGIRIFIGLIAVGALLFNVALMISDRAPGITRRLFGDFAQRLADRLDRTAAIGASDLPGNDAIVHIGVWSIAALLVALTVWRWAALIPVGVAVFAASVVVEFGQGRYSSSRAVEFSDVVANAVGVGVGIAAAAACMLCWSAVSRSLRGSRPPHR